MNARQHTDPVCNMNVTGDAKYKLAYKGEQYFFCSEHCLKQFKRAPEVYVQHAPHQSEVAQKPAATGPAGKTQYTCPMHPEVVQDQPGTCPKCGMSLAPVGAESGTKNEYTCPMHPEIVQDHPGNCPKCGMALEPVASSG